MGVCMSRIGIETVLSMDVRLGYTHDVDKLHANWTEVARSTEDRPLQCTAIKVSTHLVYTQPTHTHTLSSAPSVHTAHPHTHRL